MRTLISKIHFIIGVHDDGNYKYADILIIIKLYQI